MIGHAIKDSLAGYGLWWTWIIASGLFGLAVGLFRKYVRVINGVFDWKDILIFNLIQLLANALVWGVLAPLGDVVIYQEAAEKVFAQGIVAGIANGVSVAIAGTLLLLAYAGTQTRAGSLKRTNTLRKSLQTRQLYLQLQNSVLSNFWLALWFCSLIFMEYKMMGKAGQPVFCCL